MTFARPDPISDLETLPRMPSWVTSARAETLEDVTFLSGAALNHLHVVLGRAEVPQALLRERMALRAGRWRPRWQRFWITRERGVEGSVERSATSK